MRRSKIQIAVIDGQGGGMGRALVEQIKKAYPDIHVRALGTNAVATSAMLKAGADDGATGENAVILNAHKMDILLGPIGAAMAHGLLGEVTPAMSAAVMDSNAVKIFLPPQKKCGFRFANGTAEGLQVYLNDAMQILHEELADLL